MTPPEIFAELTRIMRVVFARGDIVATPGLTASDVIGWDSFRHVELIMEVEEAFGINIRLREQSNLGSPGDLAALIAAKLQANA